MQWVGFIIFAGLALFFKENGGEISMFFSIMFWVLIVGIIFSLAGAILEPISIKKEKELQTNEIKNKVSEYIKVLFRKRQQYITQDDYGNKNDKK